MSRPIHRWTPQEAIERGASGGKTTGKLRQRIKQLEADLEVLRRRLEDMPVASEVYLEERIKCVRLQLERFDQMLLVERDPQKAQWLATVTAKLAEQERMLAGRPAPGQLRPSAPSRRHVPRQITPE
jgi:hypothetical protein